SDPTASTGIHLPVDRRTGPKLYLDSLGHLSQFTRTEVLDPPPGGRMSEAIELYFWATPNCWKISVALEEMVLAYQVRPVAIVRGEQFSRDFLALSPNNRVPAIVDRAGPGGRTVSLFESGAILQYLGRKSGLFY